MVDTVLSAEETLKHIKEIIEITESDEVLYEGMPLSDDDQIIIRRTKEGYIVTTLYYAEPQSG